MVLKSQKAAPEHGEASSFLKSKYFVMDNLENMCYTYWATQFYIQQI